MLPPSSLPNAVRSSGISASTSGTKDGGVGDVTRCRPSTTPDGRSHKLFFLSFSSSLEESSLSARGQIQRSLLPRRSTVEGRRRNKGRHLGIAGEGEGGREGATGGRAAERTEGSSGLSRSLPVATAAAASIAGGCGGSSVAVSIEGSQMEWANPFDSKLTQIEIIRLPCGWRMGNSSLFFLSSFPAFLLSVTQFPCPKAGLVSPLRI